MPTTCGPDLEVFDFRLEPAEVARIEGLGGR